MLNAGQRPRVRATNAPRGQTLTEFALISPLFFMVLFGIVVLGIGVFYQQQVTNAAREAARYAAVHSATARCPTVSNLAPDVSLLPLPNSYTATCDPPASRWPKMTAHARERVFGLNSAGVQVTACWSGYWTKDTAGNWAAYDQIAADPNPPYTPNEFRQCTVRVYGWCDGQTGASTLQVMNPRTGEGSGCSGSNRSVSIDCSKQFPLTTSSDDMASSFAGSNADNANQVTIVTCYAWNPPLAGFLLIPSTIDMVGVVTEALEYQQ